MVNFSYISNDIPNEVGRHINYKLNLTIPFYLMASYAYYKLDKSIISDQAFDDLAKVMLENWEMIEHRHKSFINKEDLSAGTFLGKYPSMAIGAVETFIEKNSI